MLMYFGHLTTCVCTIVPYVHIISEKYAVFLAVSVPASLSHCLLFSGCGDMWKIFTCVIVNILVIHSIISPHAFSYIEIIQCCL